MLTLLPKWLRRFLRSDQHSEDLVFFREVSIFQSLSTRQLGRLKQAMQKRTYHSGEKLFSQGQVGKAVFVIKSGKVELTKELKNGEVKRLGILEPKQAFGEMALLEQMPRTASATVIEDGVIYLLYTATLDTLVRTSPSIGVKIMRNMAIMLSTLLRKANSQMERNGRPQ